MGSHRVQTPLDTQPEIAALVGRYVGQFNVLEQTLVGFCELLTGMSQPHGRIVFGGMMVQQKCRTLKALTLATLTREEGAPILALLKRINDEIEDRNDIAHQIYAARDGASLTTIDPRSVKFGTLTKEEAEKQVDRLSELSADLQQEKLKWAFSGHDFTPLVIKEAQAKERAAPHKTVRGVGVA
ncbi:hypothetical protein [Brevundimonas sp.]|uniref:hypothetical protein n=1 Tax=Brevundimonas sp. TaxID=1871086 RepID=UPI00391902E3